MDTFRRDGGTSRARQHADEVHNSRQPHLNTYE